MEVVDNKTSKKILFLPIRIVLFYFLFIALLYIFGPFEWRTENEVRLFLFLFFAHLLLYVGYTTTISSMYRQDTQPVNQKIKTNQYKVNHLQVVNYLKVFIIINFIMTLFMMIRTTGLNSFSIELILNNLVSSLNDPGKQYYSKFENQITFGGNILAPIYTLTSPLLWPVIPLSLIYFKKIGFTNKLLVILTIVFEISRWLSLGTNKGIIDLILILVSITMLKKWQQEKKDSTSNFKKNIVIGIIVGFVIVTGLKIFENNISSRVDESYIIISQTSGYTEINLEAPLMRILPDSLNSLLVYSTGYLTQGYYGLSLSLNEMFIPMFGVGSSPFLIENLEELFKVNLSQYTYQERIAYKGWDPLVNWHSIYVSFANDVSFIGVLFVMFLLGKYFAVVFYKSLIYKDPITSVLFSLLVICFFYFPLNNQVFATPGMYMAFWGLNILWVLKSRITISSRRIYR
ncbi:hypothetical protein [Exiguobacterium aurantiacum]|uniref:Oligosaccharide repeat unit polymerase n=1 Tax=Exiguobacterium aurantiacum TaxID=33987 RepID=A0A377FR03_9BACL|nr:hypothetical protein [Exiguobacterium aurantiacum]STO07252.1 Uncharacterised protein [Exiguobacterium aurantiacum]